MSSEELPTDTDEPLDLGKVFFALSDYNRRYVIAELAKDLKDSERDCRTFDLPLAKSTRSYLFRTLVDSGLLANKDYGNRATVRLRRQAIEKQLPGLISALQCEQDSHQDS